MFELGRVKPRYCVKVGAHALAWAERSTTWRGRPRYRCALSPLPAGSLKLSPIEPNLLDRPTVADRLRTLAGRGASMRVAGRTLVEEMPRPVTLLIPDLAARTVVLSFEHLPHRSEELEAILRWRLGQEQQLPVTGTKLIWQVFPPAEVHADHIVLVVAVQQSILAQYESLCESLGLLPQEVGLAGMQLFNLWFTCSGGYARLGKDLAWFTVLDGAFSCFIFHRGRPVFARTKLLGGEAGADRLDDRALTEMILREAVTSLEACAERNPDAQVHTIALMSDAGGRQLEEAMGNEFGVTVDRLSWDHVHALGWSSSGGTAALAALPAVAAMI